MKSLLLLLATFALSLQPSADCQDGAIVSGIVLGSNKGFVILSHIPRFRGNLNYDGFKSVGSPVDEGGGFSIASKSLINGGLYTLQVADNSISLHLLTGDSIYLTFDLEDLDVSLFATGRGAGKINLMRLATFRYLHFDDYDRLDAFKSQLDQDIDMQLATLQAVYDREVNHPIISKSSDRLKIKKIIDRSPLSLKEFNLVKQQILVRKFALASYLEANASDIEVDSSVEIEMYLAEVFAAENYTLIDHLNHPEIANGLENILQVEFTRSQLRENSPTTITDLSKSRRNPLYGEWGSNYIRENFPVKIHDKWVADKLAFYMTIGRPDDHKLDVFKEQCSDKKYLDRLLNFQGLLQDGLKDPRYNLSNPDRTLDKAKFESLLNSHQGHAVYLIFWSAQFAGSSIIDHLPIIKNLEQIYDEQFKVVNICIDKREQKNLWAARIIDNVWQGEHYFMPIEENKSTLVDFGNEHISSFCYGGATYSFIDRKGVINQGIAAPMQLNDYIIQKILN